MGKKRLYMDFENDLLKRWIKQFLPPCIKKSKHELNADVIVLSTDSKDWEARCKFLSGTGHIVLVLTPDSKGVLGSKIIRAGGKITIYRGMNDGRGVLIRILELIIPLPQSIDEEEFYVPTAGEAEVLQILVDTVNEEGGWSGSVTDLITDLNLDVSSWNSQRLGVLLDKAKVWIQDQGVGVEYTRQRGRSNWKFRIE